MTYNQLFTKKALEPRTKQVIKLNVKQGMPVKWEQIKRVWSRKSDFVLFLSKVQFIYLPHRVFNSDNERKFLEAILKRKGYIK